MGSIGSRDLHIPGWRHPDQVGAHCPDDPLAEHDESDGDAEPPVQGDEHRGSHLIALDYPVLTLYTQVR